MQAHEEHLTRLVGEVGRLITSTLLVEASTPEDDLLATGVLDSMTLINLLATLEERFGIRIALDELQIDDVRSILSIARLIEALLSAACQRNGAWRETGCSTRHGRRPCRRCRVLKRTPQKKKVANIDHEHSRD